jgi:hypothetical protein
MIQQSQQQFEANLLSRINQLNALLVPYGRVLLPLWVSNKYVTHIEQIASALTGATTDQQRADTLKLIDTFISREVFDPTIRAFQCHRATEVPGIQDYSTHLELATSHYYRRDYLSALKVMVPLIEGIILRLMQAPITQKVSNKDLIKFLRQMQPNPANDTAYSADARLPGRFASFRDLLCDFLSNRFYENVATAQSSGQFDFSMLNRHFILHQLDNKPFDSLHDCQTMFQLFDLLLETISCQTGSSSSYSFVPDDSSTRQRESFYWSAILSDYFKANEAAQIVDLLAMHGSYTHPQEDTNWLALNGHPMEDKEAVMLSHGLRKVSQRTVANIMFNLPQVEPRKQGLLKSAMEITVFVATQLRHEVSEGAYYLWLRRGARHGHDLKDWLESEERVKKRHPSLMS